MGKSDILKKAKAYFESGGKSLSGFEMVVSYRQIKKHFGSWKLLKEAAFTPPKEGDDSQDEDINLLLRVIHKRKPTCLADICNTINKTPAAVSALIEKAKQSGHKISAFEEGLIYTPDHDRRDECVKSIEKSGKTIEFGVISDTHYGSIHCCAEEITDCINIMYDCGIRTVFHCGDWIAGNNVYRGQAADLSCWSIGDQVDILARELPRLDGLRYIGILGNHDTSARKSSGIDVARLIMSERNDIEIRGDHESRVKMGNCKIMLVHGMGGGSYAVSYNLQKRIGEIPGGAKPDIYLMGHYHKYACVYVRNTRGFLIPCFESRTELGKRLGGTPVIGGLRIRAELLENGFPRTCEVTDISYYLNEASWGEAGGEV